MWCQHGSLQFRLLATALICLIATSEELLALHNRILPGQVQQAAEALQLGRLFSIPGSLQHASTKQQQQQQQQQEDRVTFLVAGMRCQGCARHLKTQLLQVPGVKHVSIDFDTKRVSSERAVLLGL
jgi:hypothetical protein